MKKKCTPEQQEKAKQFIKEGLELTLEQKNLLYEEIKKGNNEIKDIFIKAALSQEPEAIAMLKGILLGLESKK